MDWYFVCLAPKKTLKIKTFPCNVGRKPLGVSSVSFDDPSMSRMQFSLTKMMGQVYYVNKSQENFSGLLVFLLYISLKDRKHIGTARAITLGQNSGGLYCRDNMIVLIKDFYSVRDLRHFEVHLAVWPQGR